MEAVLQKIDEFHRMAGFPPPATDVSRVDDNDIILWSKLIEDETKELIEALQSKDATHIAKEVTDVLYVALGIARRWGIPIEPVFNAVHLSNMSKFGPNGEVYKDETGKVIKPAWFKRAEPAITEILGLA